MSWQIICVEIFRCIGSVVRGRTGGRPIVSNQHSSLFVDERKNSSIIFFVSSRCFSLLWDEIVWLDVGDGTINEFDWVSRKEKKRKTWKIRENDENLPERRSELFSVVCSLEKEEKRRRSMKKNREKRTDFRLIILRHRSVWHRLKNENDSKTLKITRRRDPDRRKRVRFLRLGDDLPARILSFSMPWESLISSLTIIWIKTSSSICWPEEKKSHFQFVFVFFRKEKTSLFYSSN